MTADHDGSTHHLQGANTHPDGDRCDLEFCQRCGHAFTTALEGYFVDKADVGPDAKGGTAEVFRLDVEDRSGDEWMGFEEEDIGPWCDQCSWHLQRKRTKRAVTDGGVDRPDGGTDRLPPCPDCGGRSYSEGGRFGTLSCDGCGYTPRKKMREQIAEVLAADE